ncbi:hypothetical protein B4589_010240 [Halolamina sp. CBA1230]|uniref:hypothetical protein n=1 Tax=Halolamina sp. CBA1230 TaxID=1853690 RepID=UPI0009A20C62|nr:hypothetical protein [Halolamina sp. CBA1230]QKY20739.1 hypothetical protein B4589_010240 [Halolamina sp. CBA1230]
MSTNVIPTEEELGAAQFTGVRAPRALGESDLRQCADPRGSPDEGVPIMRDIHGVLPHFFLFHTILSFTIQLM